jgi:hypothetical protein
MLREIRLQRPRRGDEEQHRAVTKYIAGFLMLGRYIQWGSAVLGPHIAGQHRIAAHLGNRISAQSENPRRLAPALPNITGRPPNQSPEKVSHKSGRVLLRHSAAKCRRSVASPALIWTNAPRPDLWAASTFVAGRWRKG